MGAPIDGGNAKGVAKTVEAQAPGDADDVAAINDAFSKAAALLRVLVEMHACRVLVEACGKGVLGLFDRHAVDVVDLLADFVIVETKGGTGKLIVVENEFYLCWKGLFCQNDFFGQVGNDGFWCRRVCVALADHDPADEFQHRLAALVDAF